MKSNALFSSYYFLWCTVLFLSLQSCSSQKETAAHAGMQNLTAKFNIIYNSTLLLDEVDYNLESSHSDDYNQILSVYLEPNRHISSSQIPLLDSVIRKADKIIEEKSASNFVDDAYFLIAIAQYKKANFFEAAEYFSYIIRTYPDNKDLTRTSLVMKARAEMQLGNLNEAHQTLDVAIKNIQHGKKLTADVYATKAQLHILRQDYVSAIDNLQRALTTNSSKNSKTRWRFILGQLQLGEGETAEAYDNFKMVSRSNATYEMSFNAKLNHLLIQERSKNNGNDFTSQLQRLLKDDKNADFNDQIFYRIAEQHRKKHEIKDALDNYNKAIQLSSYNNTQKGLAYLRIADLYFDTAKYSTAKLYLDSTLQALPPSFPEYEQIRKKNNYLDYLAERLQIIAREEKLQALARLPESERNGQRELHDQSGNKVAAQFSNTTLDNTNEIVNTNGKFYFENVVALSQGLSDFKKVWGNRPLEDHWRRSEKVSLEDKTQIASYEAVIPSNNSDALSTGGPKEKNDSLPTTPGKLQQSNLRIINAMYDIALFYKDELKDAGQAIKTFENLLERFPDADLASAVNYSLYQLYLPLDKARADYYKSIILTAYPQSTFAKVIIDPEFANTDDERNAKLNRIYNEVFNSYSEKNYSLVISRIKDLAKEYGNNKLSPQFAYLNALSVGKTQKLPAFEEALNSIVESYPDDLFVSPLVRQHLKYIDLNRIEFSSRVVALEDHSETEVEFANEVLPEVQNKSQKPPIQVMSVPVEEVEQAAPASAPPAILKDVAEKSLFTLPDSSEYYFVVNVQSPSLNLSSSRFGIGQFNRTNLHSEHVKHQLINVNNENQLILVGAFNNKVSATDYATRISALIKEIMKIPVEKYNTFVITKEGLDKLKDSILINSYLDFYKNSQ